MRSHSTFVFIWGRGRGVRMNDFCGPLWSLSLCSYVAPCLNAVFRFAVLPFVHSRISEAKVSFHSAAWLVEQKPNAYHWEHSSTSSLLCTLSQVQKSKTCCIFSNLHPPSRTKYRIEVMAEWLFTVQFFKLVCVFEVLIIKYWGENGTVSARNLVYISKRGGRLGRFWTALSSETAVQLMTDLCTGELLELTPHPQPSGPCCTAHSCCLRLPPGPSLSPPPPPWGFAKIWSTASEDPDQHHL